MLEILKKPSSTRTSVFHILIVSKLPGKTNGFLAIVPVPYFLFSPLLQRMRMVALEHMIQSKIVIGEGTDALEMIERMSRAIRDNPSCYQTRHVRFLFYI